MKKSEPNLSKQQPKGQPDNTENILKILALLRQNGIPCCLETELTTPALEEVIMGEG